MPWCFAIIWSVAQWAVEEALSLLIVCCGLPWNKYCSISLEFCLAGRLMVSLSTMLISSLPEKWSFCIFQHLVWILGLKPSVGGALKPGRAVEGPSTVSMIVYFSVNDYIVFSIIICKTYFYLFSRFWLQQLWLICHLYPAWFQNFLKTHSKKPYLVIKIICVYQTRQCFDSCYFSGTLMMCLYIT